MNEIIYGRPYSRLYKSSVDSEIKMLVSALNSDYTVTSASCSGHGNKRAYVMLYVRMDILGLFMEIIDTIHRNIDNIRFNLEVDWWFDGSTPLKDFPGWILLRLEITQADRHPTSIDLDNIAKIFSNMLPGSGSALRWSKRIVEVVSVDIDIDGIG